MIKPDIVKINVGVDKIGLVCGKHKNTSMDLITQMFKLNMFEEIKELNEFNYCENTKKTAEMPSEPWKFCSLPDNFEENVKDYQMIIAADFEAFTVNDNGTYIQHEEFLCCWKDIKTNITGNSASIHGLVKNIKKTIDIIFPQMEQQE